MNTEKHVMMKKGVKISPMKIKSIVDPMIDSYARVMGSAPLGLAVGPTEYLSLKHLGTEPGDQVLEGDSTQLFYREVPVYLMQQSISITLLIDSSLAVELAEGEILELSEEWEV